MGLEGMPARKVIHILKADCGTHFDPAVVAAFLRCLPKALERYRGNHFSNAYVDEMLTALGATDPDGTDPQSRP
jgi:response regulator RpfG family c-di-GMP phosphodiesterase